MKTFRLFFIVIIVITLKTTIVQSQPLAIENASWLIHNRSMIPFGYFHSFWGYTIKGDTIINGKAYKKVFSFDILETFETSTTVLNPIPPLHLMMMNLKGFLRDEGQKVYAITLNNNFSCLANIEYELLYFVYNVGDTLYLCIADYPPYPFYMVDSIKYNAPPFNRKNIYSHGNVIYQGIGTSVGLFEAFEVIDSWFNLERYSTNGTSGIGVITGNKNTKKTKHSFNIFPNPAKDKININYQDNENLSGTDICIRNAQGQLVLQRTLEQNITQIDISQLQQGVYVAKINHSDGSVIQKKFIVIK